LGSRASIVHCNIDGHAFVERGTGSMSDGDKVKTDALAEKAYAKAAESIEPIKAKPVMGAATEAKAGVAPAKPLVAAAPAAIESQPMTIPSVKPKAPDRPKPTAKAKPIAKAKPMAKAKPVAKVTPVASAKAKPAAKTTAPSVAKAAAPVPKPAASGKSTTTIKAPITKTKETTMSMKDKVTTGLETVMNEAQTKAKEAFEKSSAMFGDYAEFAKGNVEAMVESGKIFAEGIQDMSTNLVAEGRTAFESVSADIKQMAAAKSPTDLIQLQSEMVRKSFDSAVAYGSKNTEAMLKIASEAMAPLSSRVTLAVDKVRQAAA
jgi:phasin family protein